MTRQQQAATRELLRAEIAWLQAYGWTVHIDGRLSHRSAKGPLTDYSVSDAMAMTRENKLKFGFSHV